MQVYETFKSETVSDLNLPMGSLYLLAAPSTPRRVQVEVIERVKRGELVSHKEVKALISSARETALARDNSGKTNSEPKKALSPIIGEIPRGKRCRKEKYPSRPRSRVGCRATLPCQKIWRDPLRLRMEM